MIFVFSDFRKQEFEVRLNEKAQSAIKLLNDYKALDVRILQLVDSNTIHKLYNEKMLVFDSTLHLVYSSLDDTRIKWNYADLQSLKTKGSFFKKEKDLETFGFYYSGKEGVYYVLISAEDHYGKRKLEYLIYTLLGAYLLFTVITWILAFMIVKRQLRPLDFFHKRISSINEQHLELQLETQPDSKHEIDLLSNEFNFMMSRIADAYQKQKEFKSQASHELRTPLARISAQLENQIKASDAKQKEVLSQIFEDVNRLNELINSLLLLSRTEIQKSPVRETARLDEVVYSSIEKISAQFPEIKINLEIDLADHLEAILEIRGNSALLELSVTNLLKNAYLYSNDRMVNIVIRESKNSLVLVMSNKGDTLSPDEQKNMFQPFMRGRNSKGYNGLGLGLRIVQRILNSYEYKVVYDIQNELNCFTVYF